MNPLTRREIIGMGTAATRIHGDRLCSAQVNSATAVASVAAARSAFAFGDDRDAPSESPAAGGHSMFAPIVIDQEASKSGTIHVQHRIYPPKSITITRIAIVTTTGCRSREHESSVTIGTHPEIKFKLKDCTVYEQMVRIAVATRSVEVHIRSGGFDPGERVQGLLTLEFH